MTLYAFLSQNFDYVGKEESVTLLPTTMVPTRKAMLAQVMPVSR